MIRSLDNAVADAQSIENTLDSLGFQVTLETNRDLRRLRRALDDFRDDGKGADVALVFFAGHGVEISGENRLLPIDAKPAATARFIRVALFRAAEDAPIAAGHVLDGLEGEVREAREAAHGASSVRSAQRLCRAFDEDDLVSCRHLAEHVQLARISPQ